LFQGQGGDKQEGKKVVNLHYICQEWEVRKAAIMNEQVVQHTNKPAQDADVFPQQELSTPATPGEARSNKPR